MTKSIDIRAANQLQPEEAPVSCPLLRDVLTARREFLSRGVEEIRTDLESRRVLHEEITPGLDADLGSMRLHRAYLENWATGYEPSVDARKSAVDRQIADARQAMIEEDLAFWRDTIALHKELRLALASEQLAAAGEGLGDGGAP